MTSKGYVAAAIGALAGFILLIGLIVTAPTLARSVGVPMLMPGTAWGQMMQGQGMMGGTMGSRGTMTDMMGSGGKGMMGSGGTNMMGGGRTEMMGQHGRMMDNLDTATTESMRQLHETCTKILNEQAPKK